MKLSKRFKKRLKLDVKFVYIFEIKGGNVKEDIIKSEEFYKDLYNASSTVVNRFYRASFNKNDLINAGIDYVLFNFNSLNLIGDKFTDFKILMNKCSIGIIHYLKKNEKIVYFDDLNDNICNFEVNYSYENLKDLLFQFLQNYDFEKRRVILFNIYIQDMLVVSRMLELGLRSVAKIINDFRIEFANFLIQCGYLENLDILKNLKSKILTESVKKSKLRKVGALSFDSYSNDYLIYKLLRREKDLRQYADCLNVSVDYIENIIYHKVKKLNLSLYNVQKLRHTYFQNYSLCELVEVEKCCI